MVIKEHEKRLSNIENAHFVMLSLYREYSIMMLNNYYKKETCIARMRQIKNDLKYLTKDQLLAKAENIYKPILQKMENRGIEPPSLILEINILPLN